MDGAREPVALSSGVFVLEQTDPVIPGRLPLVFTRIYRSRANRSGPFGFGWSHNFELVLVFCPLSN
jgi:hypothetical protein